MNIYVANKQIMPYYREVVEGRVDTEWRLTVNFQSNFRPRKVASKGGRGGGRRVTDGGEKKSSFVCTFWSGAVSCLGKSSWVRSRSCLTAGRTPQR